MRDVGRDGGLPGRLLRNAPWARSSLRKCWHAAARRKAPTTRAATTMMASSSSIGEERPSPLPASTYGARAGQRSVGSSRGYFNESRTDAARDKVDARERQEQNNFKHDLRETD